MVETKPNGTGDEPEPSHLRRSVRRERGIERTRQDILEAAGRAFARRGFHGTTMEEVAQETGYSVGALYTYFKGKEDLYRSLVEAISGEIQAAMDRPMPPSLSYRQRVELRLLRLFEVMEAKRDLLAMYVAQRLSPDWELGSELGDIYEGVRQGAIDRWADDLREGMALGEVRSTADPRDMAPFVLGVVNATVMQWARTNPSGSLTEYASAVTRFIFDGVGTGAREGEPRPSATGSEAGEPGGKP